MECKFYFSASCPKETRQWGIAAESARALRLLWSSDDAHGHNHALDLDCAKYALKNGSSRLIDEEASKFIENSAKTTVPVALIIDLLRVSEVIENLIIVVIDLIFFQGSISR